jgi:CBS domain containing-hemolysin-like protein
MASRVRLRTRAQQGRRGAGRAERLLAHPERAIVTCLVGVNLVNIALATTARAAVLALHPFAAAAADAIATLVTVPLVLVLGEALPKALAQTYPNRTLAWFALPLHLVRWVLWPITQFSFGVAAAVRRLAGLHADPLEFVSREELKQFVAHSEKRGHVDADERELIYRIFEFWKLDPARLVRPLEAVPHVAADAPAGRAKQILREGRAARLVVTDAAGREVLGVTSATALLEAPNDAPVGRYLRAPVRLPLGRGIDRLLTELQRSPSHVAVVQGGAGGTPGIILLDDVLQRLLGRDAAPAVPAVAAGTAGSHAGSREERP